MTAKPLMSGYRDAHFLVTVHGQDQVRLVLMTVEVAGDSWLNRVSD